MVIRRQCQQKNKSELSDLFLMFQRNIKNIGKNILVEINKKIPNIGNIYIKKNSNIPPIMHKKTLSATPSGSIIKI
jgi:hypothetical protein